MVSLTDEYYMQKALFLAEQAAKEGEVPVGALLVVGNDIVGEGWNRPIGSNDPTAHAEVLAIREAANAIGDWRLNGCTLAVTLEPCCMCAGAIVLARIDRVVYGATDPKAGAVNTLYQICNDERLNHRCEIIPGVNASACGQLLTDFFKIQRAAGKK